MAKFNPLPTPPFLKKDFAELKVIFIFYDLYCFVQCKDFLWDGPPLKPFLARRSGLILLNHMIENFSPVGGTRRGNVETAFFPQIYVLMSSAYYC